MSGSYPVPPNTRTVLDPQIWQLPTSISLPSQQWVGAYASVSPPLPGNPELGNYPQSVLRSLPIPPSQKILSAKQGFVTIASIMVGV